MAPPTIKGISSFVKSNPIKTGAVLGAGAAILKHRAEKEATGATSAAKPSKPNPARIKQAAQLDNDAKAADYQARVASAKQHVIEAEQAVDDANHTLDELLAEAKKAGVKVSK